MKKIDQIKIMAAAIDRAQAGKEGGELEAVVGNFCSYLKKKRMVRLVPDILGELENIYAAKQGRVMVKITAKNKLDAINLKKILAIVKKNTGKEAVADQEIDPSLLGGAVARYEDKMLDFSVKTRIRKLAKQLAG